MSKRFTLKRYLPILVWGPRYTRERLRDDLIASVLVAVMLIPQALAYALIAGVSPELGLYAAILGLAGYAFFGSSSTLSVGPVAVLSLMTAAALGKLSITSAADYAAAATALALMSGGLLLLLGLLRLGFMANFISHPVVSAFVTASALLIGLNQMEYLLDIRISGDDAVSMLRSLIEGINNINYATLSLGVIAMLLIVWCKSGLQNGLLRLGWSESRARLIGRSGPLLVVVFSAGCARLFNLQDYGVVLLGTVPAGLPEMRLPSVSLDLIRALWGSAILIAIIGYVESLSVGQVLAARRRERLNLDQELIGLGAANIASSAGGGFPVSAGFSRSIVNFSAGAATPAAGLFTAIFVAGVALLLTPVLFWLPRYALAAIILVAIVPLIDLGMLIRSFRFSKADFTAVLFTLLLTLTIGVEVGVAAGVLASIVMHLYKTSKPHVAVVGRVRDTEHFRNVQRHKVETFESLLSIRVDESLYFANSRYLEEMIFNMAAKKNNLKHVILMCTAVNEIDLSALEALETINDTLEELDIKLHLSEVKGPIMDRLGSSGFFTRLTGNNYLSHNQAVEDLRVAAKPDNAESDSQDKSKDDTAKGV